MRRKMLIAALLSTTALVPARADAGVVAAFISGLTGITTTAGVVGAVAGSLGIVSPLSVGFGLGAFLGGTLVGRLLLSVGLSAIAASFVPQPSLPKPSARLANFAQPLAYAETVYGRTRKGGPLGFTGAQGGKRFYVPILASHEIEGVVEHWLDEWTVGVDETVTDWQDSNLLTSADSSDYTAPEIIGASAKGAGRIDFFTGAAGQTANAGLVSEFAQITSEFDFKGLAGATLWARKPDPSKFAEIYPRSREWGYAPVIDGHNGIYDPRDGTSTGYTNNAALILAHWLTDRLGQEVDWDDVAVEADVSDETVTDRNGETLPRWTINGTISDDQSFEVQRGQLAGACDAFIFERPDGKVGFYVGRWIEPTVTLSSDDFFVLRLQQGQWGADAPSEVQVIYTEPANAWRESAAAVWVEDADARRIRDEPQLFMVTHHNQAARLSKRIAKARRPEWSLSGTIGPIGYELLEERFFTLEHVVHGTLTFEVSRLYRTGAATYELEAVSAQESDFAFGAAEEEGAPPQRLVVDSSFEIDAPTNVSATAGDTGSIVVEWDPAPDFARTEIRWRASGATEYQYALTTEPEVGEYIITGLTDGETYEIQVRHRSGSTETAWTPDPALEVVALANTTAPGDLTAFSTALSGSDVTVSWTSPNDSNYSGARIYRGTSATFSAATLIATEFGPPNAADSYQDTGLAAGTYYFWAVPINASGVEGNASGPETETVT